jgi:uncharacterized LabA/DUF88 family protein
MSQNVGVFVDVSNLFYSAKSAGVEVNYCRLLEHAIAGRDLIRACAYTGVDPDNPNQRRFIDFLRANGYKVVCKDIHKYEGGRIKANLDIEMAVDIMLLSDNLDVVVLVSGDGDFVRLLEAVQTRGVRCEIISFGISTSNELIEAADLFTEIGALQGIFRNAPSGPGAQYQHGAAGAEGRASYGYSAFQLHAERVSGERERARVAERDPQYWEGRGHSAHSYQDAIGQHSTNGDRPSQPAGFNFATHEEPFMLPDAEACVDPHSKALPRPGSVPGDHEDA